MHGWCGRRSKDSATSIESLRFAIAGSELLSSEIRPNPDHCGDHVTEDVIDQKNTSGNVLWQKVEGSIFYRFAKVAFDVICVTCLWQAGINSGDSIVSYSLPGSMTPSVLQLAQTSNVGLPGRWIFRVDGPNVLLPNYPSSPSVNGIQVQQESQEG